MENLKRSFSVKFLECISQLGTVIPINDESFYIALNNYRGAFVRFESDNSIYIRSMRVLSYDKLSLETDHEIEESGCNEGHILWILKGLTN